MSWSLFLIKLQTCRPAKRLQHRYFPVNIAKFLRTPFLQNASDCFCKMMKFNKDSTFVSIFFLNDDVISFVKILRSIEMYFYGHFQTHVLINFFIRLRRAKVITWENFVPAKRDPGSTKKGFRLPGIRNVLHVIARCNL